MRKSAEMKTAILAIVATAGLIFGLLAGCLLTHEETRIEKIPPERLKEDV